MEPSFIYRCELIRVVDGDTVDIWVDCGFQIRHRLTVRVLGVNAPEMHGVSRALGEKAKRYTEEWFAEIKDLCVQTTQDGTFKVDSFRRYLADFSGTYPNGERGKLADALLASGNAVVFLNKKESE